MRAPLLAYNPGRRLCYIQQSNWTVVTEKQRYKGTAHYLRINVSVALPFCIFSLPIKDSLLLSFKKQEKATQMHCKYRGISDSDVSVCSI